MNVVTANTARPPADHKRLSADLIHDYVAGLLSPGRHTVIDMMRKMSPEVDANIAFEEALSEALSDDLDEISMSAGFFDRVLEQLPAAPMKAQEPSSSDDILDSMDDLNWRNVMPGVRTCDIAGQHGDDERLFLLGIRGGMKMPTHSHTGEEWALILKGSYTVDGQTYTPGDIHIEDENTTHQPRVDDGEECICLVMVEGPLVMKDFIPKLLQPYIGV